MHSGDNRGENEFTDAQLRMATPGLPDWSMPPPDNIRQRHTKRNALLQQTSATFKRL